jgi:hypothetical protein
VRPVSELSDEEIQAELDCMKAEGSNGAGPTKAPVDYTVEIDAKGKLVLPAVPELEDVAGHCAWLTAVFALDPAHPITGGRRFGIHGPLGHAELSRREASRINFEPVTQINTPTKLIEALTWAAIPSDSAVPALKGEHCRQIAHVVKMLCGMRETLTQEQETTGIIGTFLQGALITEEAVTSYGNSGQRYEAAVALRRDLPYGPPRYAIDFNTGELLIGVGDLAEAARRHLGSRVPRGWLEARMESLGWRKITLEGHALPGRSGRTGPHARIGAYRGFLTTGDISVTT